MGWENVFHCELNPFCRQVLKYHYPNSVSYEDITKTDFSVYRGRIDIITGGFPCQPYSLAGKRLGKDDERHLWPEMLRVIREVSPKWIVGENVFGIVNWSGGLVFEEVQADLEREGYEVQSYILPAAGVDAPHKRDRVWFVAYSNRSRYSSGREQVSEENGIQGERREEVGAGQSKVGGEGCESTNAAKANGEVTDASNTSHTRLQRSEEFGSVRWRGEKSHEQPSRCFFSNWQNFPTQSPVCVGNDGVYSRLDPSAISFPKWRNESIKAAGNAVVPQVVLQIFKAIQAYEDSI
jgi:DNA (cytosine-5)-methyltransferase 1